MGNATALITGATAGIGAEFARAMAARGDDLVLVARDEERLHRHADRLGREHRVGVEVLAADLTDRAALDRVAARLADRDRPIRTLVNNAGFGLNTRFTASSVDDEQRLLDLLVTATMRLTHAALPGMLARRVGSVLTVSSLSGWVTAGTYSAAKAWQTVFCESLARELAGTGVRVTVVAPGYTRTEFHDRGGMDMSRLPDRLWLGADEVVATALRDEERGRTVSVPGATYKALALAVRYLPRPLIRRTTGGPHRAGLRGKD